MAAFHHLSGESDFKFFPQYIQMLDYIISTRKSLRSRAFAAESITHSKHGSHTH